VRRYGVFAIAFAVILLAGYGGDAAARTGTSASHQARTPPPPVGAAVIAGFLPDRQTGVPAGAIPATDLVRRGFHVSLWPFPAKGRIGLGALVFWSRGIWSGDGPPRRLLPWLGLLFWQHQAGTRPGWRLLWQEPVSFDYRLSVRVGDANGDGYPDLLTTQRVGSGDCGLIRVVSVAAGRAVAIYKASDSCDYYAIGGGRLTIWHYFGACPGGGSYHCHLGLRLTSYSWHKGRFLPVHWQATCLIAYGPVGRRACKRAHVPIGALETAFRGI
jgi:hypothetical protein